MIAWDKQYETGIKSIDEQHKQLLVHINDLSDLLTNAVDGEDIYDSMVDIIQSLKEYTVYHFQYEESLFDKFNYINTYQHKEEHSKFINNIENLDYSNIDEDQVTHGKNILKFLLTWLFSHISGTDFLYKDFLLANSVE